MSYLLIKRCNLPSLNVKNSNPHIGSLWLTRLKCGAILYSYKRNEKNILSGIRQFNTSYSQESYFGGTFPTPPAKLHLIHNILSIVIFSSMKSESIFLRLPQVVERVNFSKSTISRREKEGKFPQRIKFGNIVFWHSCEIEKFQQDPNGYVIKGGRK